VTAIDIRQPSNSPAARTAFTTARKWSRPRSLATQFPSRDAATASMAVLITFRSRLDDDREALTSPRLDATAIRIQSISQERFGTGRLAFVPPNYDAVSQLTIVGISSYDLDQLATAKEGNFYTVPTTRW
jgi:hypothetical protein